ncbi:MAG: peptide ABC transporter ATP-binding protein, partial [Oscillospiraceae bacterium]|nr:peptide ABC transporter ATP-binding protein [Oscillospiraceae bacterium]
KHPYTWGLLKSMPKLSADSKEELISIEGAPPDLFAPPKGCAFAARCEYAMEICREHQPPFVDVGDNHCAACWLNMKDVPDENRPDWMKSDHVSLEEVK